MAPPPAAAPALLLLIAIHLHRRRSKSPSPGMMAHGTKVPHPHLARPRSRVYPGRPGSRAMTGIVRVARFSMTRALRSWLSVEPTPLVHRPHLAGRHPRLRIPRRMWGRGGPRLRSLNPANTEHPFLSDPPAILRVQRGPA